MKLVRPRTVLLAGIGTAVVAVLAWLLATQGPLAPVKVTVVPVAQGDLVASTFGIGTVEARRSYAIGPTVPSRVLRVLVDHGDEVKRGQLVAELDPVDLADRVASAQSAVERTASGIRAAEAQLAEAQSRAALAAASARRYSDLRGRGFVSQEALDTRTHEANAAQAGRDAAVAALAAARRDRERAVADHAAVAKVRAQTRLVSPVDGVVSARLVEPGSTLVAGQAVVQIIDPASLWVRARIDQGRAGGVRVGQPAEVVLRADTGRTWRAQVQRVDWMSDAVAEERIVNVGFVEPPPAMSVGDLVEVTLQVAQVAAAHHVPTAAVKRVERDDAVFVVVEGRVELRRVRTGITTLDGRTQILAGLEPGDAVAVHSTRRLEAGSKVKVVPAIVAQLP